MIRQLVTYKSYNGDEITEELYFNLTKAELIELEMASGGGLSERLKILAETQDGRQIIKQFKQIIQVSYGEKTEDGRRFVKNPDILGAFMTSEVYSEFFMQLMTIDGAAAKFIKGVIPEGLLNSIMEELGEDPSKLNNEETDSDAVKTESDSVEVINRSEYNVMSPTDKAAVAQKVTKGKAVFHEDISS